MSIKIHASQPACLLLAAVCASSTAFSAEQSALSLDVFGLSYHTDRQATKRQHFDNEVNLGLGLSYELSNTERGVAFVQAGFYHDSGRNWAKIAGPAYQLKFGERWRLGGALLAIHSPSYNHGRPFIAPVPLVSYDLGSFKLNATYVPRFQQYNEFAVFGFYLSIPFR